MDKAIAVENDMRKPVVDWLAAKGYEDAHECYVGGHYCDVIGFRFATRAGRPVPQLRAVVCVELKMSNVQQVIRQARGNARSCNASYAAMPLDRCAKMRATTRAIFSRRGIGLLSVDGLRVAVQIPAVRLHDGREQSYKRTWWRWHLRNEKKKPRPSPARGQAIERGDG